MSEMRIFTGPMYSGKTTRLLSALERYSYQNKKIALYKPAIDNRYSREKVVTHSGISWDAFRVPDGEGILLSLPPDAEIVAVDEMFMIPGSAEALLKLYFSGVTVLISTLQLSSEGKPFSEVTKILPYATCIQVCASVCAHESCSADAYFTRRLKEGGEEIEIGGVETYEPLCLEHYTKLKRRDEWLI